MLNEFDLHAIGRHEIDDAVRKLIGLGAEETTDATFLGAAADEVARRVGARVGI